MDVIKIIVESGPASFGDNHPLMPVEMVRAIVDEAAQDDPFLQATFVATSWRGASLATGATLVTIGSILYVVAYGRPVPTGPDGEITLADHAAHKVAH